ncbi:MAG: preprotein translocase subunit Sec61beta [Sulfolobales archaeon]|nr:preprotein translocase subunit Sec61beta [Sulfolobales archaeon]MCX8209289.1 preprotein translocase subunit Sec61beta [Sulfolobales archaeon]MDW8010927.1 preprotein translocase subunit Sec61beta [Sulfolobales archaeon]
MSTARRRRREAPVSPGAGLVRFFEEVESIFEITPKQLVVISIIFVVSIAILNLLAR